MMCSKLIIGALLHGFYGKSSQFWDPEKSNKNVTQAGGIYFYPSTSDWSDMEPTRETKTTLYNVFKLLMHDMLSELAFLPVLFFLSSVFHSFQCPSGRKI